MEKLSVVLPDGEESKTLIIREGQALPLHNPESIRLSGNIESITNFLARRYNGEKGKGLQEVDKEKAVVIVNDKLMKIELFLDPENHFNTQVTAALELTEELKAFQINIGKQWTREELVKHIRLNRRFFPDPIKHEELLFAWMKLNLSINSELKNESDNRGNKEQYFKKKINSEGIPTEFTLRMPIFRGQEERDFKVQIFLEATDASVRFEFESVDLIELVDRDMKELFQEQLEYCQDFVIIHK